jgi:hypothetical protein
LFRDPENDRPVGFGKFLPGATWQDESHLGDAWLQVSGNLN